MSGSLLVGSWEIQHIHQDGLLTTLTNTSRFEKCFTDSLLNPVNILSTLRLHSTNAYYSQVREFIFMVFCQYHLFECPSLFELSETTLLPMFEKVTNVQSVR